MKKLTFIAAIVAALSLTSCEKEMLNQNKTDKQEEFVKVTMTFTPYEQQSMGTTRTVTSISEYCTRLDIWLSDGENITAYHQASVDDGFGTLSITLNLTKTYTIYAVAHRCTSDATLTDDVISFPDDKLTHSFFVTRQFTPTKGMSLDLTMQRIVAQFQFNTTDAVPDWCKSIRFTVYNIFDRWNVAGYGVHELNRVSTINISSKNQDGTVTCNVYAIVTSTSTNHDVLVEALDNNGAVQESHLFENVPLRNEYRTISSGAFFTDAASNFSFKADDWTGIIDYGF